MKGQGRGQEAQKKINRNVKNSPPHEGETETGVKGHLSTGREVEGHLSTEIRGQGHQDSETGVVTPHHQNIRKYIEKKKDIETVINRDTET